MPSEVAALSEAKIGPQSGESLGESAPLESHKEKQLKQQQLRQHQHKEIAIASEPGDWRALHPFLDRVVITTMNRSSTSSSGRCGGSRCSYDGSSSRVTIGIQTAYLNHGKLVKFVELTHGSMLCKMHLSSEAQVTNSRAKIIFCLIIKHAQPHPGHNSADSIRTATTGQNTRHKVHDD